MPVTIYLVRHAESIANATRDVSYHDPELTALGYQQSKGLRAEFTEIGHIDMVFVSPMKRAMQTALWVFPGYTNRFILLPGLQEHGGTPLAPCDIGSRPEALLRQFGNTRFDYSHMTENWSDKGPGSFYAPSNANERARSVRQFIREAVKPFEGKDANIVVVTHSRFIQFLTESDVIYGNAEGRPYKFGPVPETDTQAKLVEISADDKSNSK